ncbi:MAG TPA: hypothetical protein PKD99_17795 [Sphingopyxis sp.]|nr:hypothetical protein [Sphingopyxis sp.]HMP46954.1 hypothetical protein [Sphingopyxis sp.]HMQ19240.1 hypothetical protein [Sphingopyxis sp.]
MKGERKRVGGIAVGQFRPIADMLIATMMGPMRVSLISLIAMIVATLSACGNSGLPDNPLFAGVERSTYSDGTMLLQERLTARFYGSPEQELEKFLKEQGFEVKHPEQGSMSVSRVASYKFGASFCGSQVRIVWAVDATGKIRNIDALYTDTGCP